MTGPAADGLDVHVTVRRGTFELSAAAAARGGEVLAVLGPNGAGKSTLLRAVAGLAAVDDGRIALNGTVFDEPATHTFVSAQRRELGVVFQDHRLFSHQRVLGNVAFGPRSRGVRGAQAQATAQGWLDRLGIGDLARRHPRQLSGGQAQRVALARALASAPRALLLDEPLAALDVQTRAEVQSELREHLAAFAGPTLLVTHDAVEALLLADRIVVLEQGRVVQQGTPAEVTTMPLTPYVARLVGANLWAGRVEGTRVYVGHGVALEAAHLPAGAGQVLAAVRTSAIAIHTTEPAPASAERSVWRGTVAALAPLGDRIRVTVRGDLDADLDMDAALLAGAGFERGRAVWVSVHARDVRVYPPGRPLAA
ncbi:ABC transporter ATP-binding protein [uncultured Jatrophihabitans sp.]|uniref:ABC transporter ATP-binding protein n=1 Tax=uncultured Jatrophihabitans sp. TaxID=1610747 RepID=UPI0035CC5D3A